MEEALESHENCCPGQELIPWSRTMLRPPDGMVRNDQRACSKSSIVIKCRHDTANRHYDVRLVSYV